MNLMFRLIACCVALAFFAGCATPERRAQQHASTFKKLSPKDQQLVLSGKIRPGLGRDAVYIAWGEPDWKMQGGKGKEECESWFYYREITAPLPMSAYDIHPVSVSLSGPDYSFGIRPEYGFGGIGSSGFFDMPRPLVVDVRFKRADFREGSLKHYEVRRGSHSLLPVPPQAEEGR